MANNVVLGREVIVSLRDMLTCPVISVSYELLILFPEMVWTMNNDILGQIKLEYLKLRQALTLTGGVMSEEDILCERNLTTYLSAVARLWTRQAEGVYESQYPERDNPPETPDDPTPGPVPAK